MKKLLIVVSLLLLLTMPLSTTVTASVKDAEDGIMTMTLQQLQEYHKQLDGYMFHTVVKATFLTKDSIGANLDGKEHFFDDFSFGFRDQNPKKIVKKDDEVEITGLMDGSSYTDCHIISTGAEARSVLDDIEKNAVSLQESIDATLKRIAEDKGAGDRGRIKNKKNITIAADKLNEYCEEYDGYAFHSVMKITDVKESSIFATSYQKDKTLFHLNFDGKGDLRNAYSVGELIEVEGLIEDAWIGSVNYNSCCIISRGDDAAAALELLEGIKNERVAEETPVSEKDQEKSVAKENNLKITKQVAGEMVWISEAGVRYHTRKECSGIKNPRHITFSEAIEAGCLPCSVCVDQSADAKEGLVSDETSEVSLKETEKFENISQGTKGDKVKEVQNLLIALGFLSSAADGSYGPMTKQAVEEFQKEVGLDATGSIDENTYDILTSDQAPKKKETEPAFQNIEKGDSGERVVEIQRRLIELGYLSGLADGKFGSGTEQAVKDFQNADSLSAAGVIDETTYNALLSSDAPQKETNAPETTATTDMGRMTGAGTVYWTPNGEVYHLSSHCRTLSRSRTIYSGTVAESGKPRVCSICG